MRKRQSLFDSQEPVNWNRRALIISNVFLCCYKELDGWIIYLSMKIMVWKVIVIIIIFYLMVDINNKLKLLFIF